MRSRILLLLLPLFLLPFLAMAQEQGSVRGTVTDGQTGETIPGVNVTIVETQQGAASNAEGEYQIAGVQPGDYTLRATFVGYADREREITVRSGETTTVNLELSPGDVELGEVVVTGQGSEIETRRLSTTTETVSGEDLEDVSTGRLDQALQSQLPNAQIRLNSGQPGTSSLIRSRGPVSASGTTTPVIYVDGVRVDNRSTGSNLDIATGGARSSSIADIPLDNIDRIEFVKGGAATTLYGSDAANGVIQIFTKDGRGAQDQLNFQTRLGAEYGTRDFMKYNRTGDVVFDDPALVQSYQLSGTGSASGLNYSFSGKMFENNSARVGNENIRYDLNSSLSATPLEDLQYTGNAKFVSNRYTRAINANFTTANLRTETSQFFGQPIDSLEQDQFSTLRDSLQRADELYNNVTEVRRWQTSQSLRYSPLNSVTLKVSGGLDYRVERNKERVTNAYLRQTGQAATADPTIADFNRNFLGLTLDANLNHQASWAFLDFKTDIGTQIFRDETVITRIDADNVPDGSRTVNSASQTTGEDDLSTVAQQGYYLKENIGFGDRFFIDLGLRGDKNSAFGDELGFVWYPAVGVSYTVTDEPFVEDNIPTDIFSNLKLRANYGESGNFPNAFANETEVSAQAYLDGISYTYGNRGDADLGPERVATWEVGGDLSLFEDRIGFQVTRYHATTEDALFTPPYPPTSGQPSQQRNLGEIVNKGWEISSQFAILDQTDYGLDLSASLNTNENEVVSNGGTPKFSTGGFTFLGAHVDAGHPVGYLEGNRPIYNEDGVVSDVERNVQLGDPNPDQFGSLSLNGRYKGLSLRVTADYQRGAQGVNPDDLLRALSFANTQDEDRFPNPDSYEPPAIAEQIGFGDLPPALLQVAGLESPAISFFDVAGAFVEDTDYLKVRNISLNYRVPNSILPGTVRSVRLGVGAQNPFNFVKSSFDPEVTGSETAAGTVGGVFGYRTVSPPRQYTFTLNIGL